MNQTVSLAAGDVTDAEFEFQPDTSDVGTVTITATSEDDSASQTVSVLSPPRFNLEVLDVTEPIEGDPIEVTFSIENTGDIPGSATIDVDIEGVGTATESVALDSVESTTETVPVPTTDSDPGEYEAIVSVGNVTNTETTTVRESETATGGSDTDDTEDGAVGPTDGLGTQAPLLLAGGVVLLLGGGYIFIRRDDGSTDSSGSETPGRANSKGGEMTSENDSPRTVDPPERRAKSAVQASSSEAEPAGTAGPPMEIPSTPAKRFSYSDIERLKTLGKGGTQMSIRASSTVLNTQSRSKSLG